MWLKQDLWHRRLSHINYKALAYVSKVVTWLPYLKIDHEGTCKGCARGKNIKNPFLKTETKTKGTLELKVTLRRREPSWILLERREYLLDIVKSPKPSGYTYQDSIISRLVGM